MRVLELSSYHAIVVCVASGTGVAVLPESVLDVVKTDEVAQLSAAEGICGSNHAADLARCGAITFGSRFA